VQPTELEHLDVRGVQRSDLTHEYGVVVGPVIAVLRRVAMRRRPAPKTQTVTYKSKVVRETLVSPDEIYGQPVIGTCEPVGLRAKVLVLQQPRKTLDEEVEERGHDSIPGVANETELEVLVEPGSSLVFAYRMVVVWSFDVAHPLPVVTSVLGEPELGEYALAGRLRHMDEDATVLVRDHILNCKPADPG